MSWKSTQLSFKLIFVTSLKGYNYPEMCKQVFIKQETVFPKKQSFYPRGRAIGGEVGKAARTDLISLPGHYKGLTYFTHHTAFVKQDSIV